MLHEAIFDCPAIRKPGITQSHRDSMIFDAPAFLSSSFSVNEGLGAAQTNIFSAVSSP